jgi:hypothetical protein
MDKSQLNIISVIKEATEGLLSDDSLTAIETAFNSAVEEKTSLNVESALVKQDAEYADKLKALLEAIDKDRATKLVKVVEAVDSNNAAKLKKVVSKYKTALAKEANEFKRSLVGSISKYLEVYLEQSLPQNFINEAVLERKAQTVLENLRQHLAVDSALMKESVRTAVVDGKKQINEAHDELEKAQLRIKMLEGKLDKTQANLVFAEKTQNLPSKKREYVKRVLSGKTSDFIAENIDYTLGLFDKSESQQVDFLREQAMKDVVANDNVPVEQEIIAESANEAGNSDVKSMYLNELSKY